MDVIQEAEDLSSATISCSGRRQTRGLIARMLAHAQIRKLPNPIIKAATVYIKLANSSNHIGYRSIAEVIPDVNTMQLRRAVKAMKEGRKIGRHGGVPFLESAEIEQFKRELAARASMNIFPAT